MCHFSLSTKPPAVLLCHLSFDFTIQPLPPPPPPPLHHRPPQAEGHRSSAGLGEGAAGAARPEEGVAEAGAGCRAGPGPA